MKSLSFAAPAQMRVVAGVVTGRVVILIALAVSGCSGQQGVSQPRAADGYCRPDYPPVLCSMQRRHEQELQRR